MLAGAPRVAALAALAFLVPASAQAAENGPIVFHSESGIWRVNPDGSALKRITKRRAWNLSVSPDGRTIAFAHGGPLWTIKMNGKGLKDVLRRYPINRNVGGAYSPTWSPNGKRISYVGYNDGRLYTVKPNGTGLKRVFGKNRIIGAFADPTWNRKEIYFLDRTDYSTLKAVNVKTRKERVVWRNYDRSTGMTHESGTPEDFDVSPDGRRIAFYAPYRNWMINTDGSGLRQISPNSYFASHEFLAFSPDGTELVGASESELWAMDGENGSAESQGGYTRLLTGGHSDVPFYPDWAPKPR
jgi:Tol biopolymer transport system component